MPEKRWRAEEERVAALLGLRRNRNAGQPTPDAEGDWLVVDVKDRSRFPTWIESALLKVQSQAPWPQFAIVVLTGPTAAQDLVVMGLKDFKLLTANVALAKKRR